MSTEDSWWEDEEWWERKSIPLGFLILSFRQLVIIVLFSFLGYFASLPVRFSLLTLSFAGRAIVFLAFLLVGLALANRRVKMVPPELQLIYWLTMKMGQRKKPSDGTEKATAEGGDEIREG
jgi:ABC-type multidrug transport system permease subunit